MNRFFLLICSLWLCLPLSSQSLERYRWQERLLLVFSPQPTDQYRQQRAVLVADTAELSDRQLRVIWVSPQRATTLGHSLPRTLADRLYATYAVGRQQFAVVLIGLDGQTKRRWDDQVVRISELSTLIDQMPMRRAELGRRKRGQ